MQTQFRPLETERCATKALQNKFTPPSTAHVTLMRCPSVQNSTGLSRSAIYFLMAKGDFPTPVKISAKAVAWRSDLIDQWVLSRVAASAESMVS